MIIAQAAIAVLARKLFQKYVADPTTREIGDLMLDPDKIAEGLTKLVADGKLNLGGVTEATEIVDTVVNSVIERLKIIQQEAGVLKADGVFGERTLKWLFNRRFGHDPRPASSMPPSTTTSSPTDAIHALRWFLETELPKVPGGKALKLLRTAWESWAEVCNIDIKQTFTRDDANVIVKYEVISGDPSILATAQLGPPNGRQLELIFDKSEPSWTDQAFSGTAAHEIGHLLGLRHSTVPRQLMNDTLTDIVEPQSDDITRAQAIWGPPPK